MPEAVPQELVEMIVDDVGRGRGRVHRPPLKLKEGSSVPNPDIVVYETLKNCALVARSWTHRSQMNLFKGVVFAVNEEEGIHDLPLPSAASLGFIKFLEIAVAPENPHRGPITSYLLSVFSVCPLETLQIDRGLFSLGARPALFASFNALSGLLSDITFRFCLFEPEPLHDILSIQDTMANVTFLGCDQDHPGDPSRQDINWEPIYHSEDRTFSVIGGDGNASEEFMLDLSGLSVSFGRLEVDFYEDGEWLDATQCLIDASAGTLSFLRLNVISDSFSALSL
ncbi:hypothetical protein BJ322DRAFT_250187 [Thelephora terrestris]|uniref:Uncharacterized protein n=1 Tax=Thelephora terrestris TaxID=56493 RepID=A0A9P6H902_9AGAM|nr:hypothetical protein BJ322DRAFT_250187 [Thelephora terrestris]